LLNLCSIAFVLQVSWTKEVKDAKTGDYEVHLYDDEGYSAVKRVIERGEDASTVKPLVTIVVNYPVSNYQAWPKFLSSEVIIMNAYLNLVYKDRNETERVKSE